MSVFYAILKIKLKAMGFDPDRVEPLANHVSVELSILIIEVGF